MKDKNTALILAARTGSGIHKRRYYRTSAYIGECVLRDEAFSQVIVIIHL